MPLTWALSAGVLAVSVEPITSRRGEARRGSEAQVTKHTPFSILSLHLLPLKNSKSGKFNALMPQQVSDMPTVYNNYLAEMPILDERRAIVELKAVSEHLKTLLPASPTSPLIVPGASSVIQEVQKLIDENNHIRLLLAEYGLNYEILRNSVRGMPRSSSPIVTTNSVLQISEPKMYWSIMTNRCTFPRTRNASPSATTSPAKTFTGSTSITSRRKGAGFSARHGSACSRRVSSLDTLTMSRRRRSRHGGHPRGRIRLYIRSRIS